MKTTEGSILPTPENRLQSHGYTVAQIAEIGELQRRELKGEKCIPLIDANNAKAESIQDPFFKNEFAGHKISKFEAVHFHVAQEKRFFDPYTGERASKGSVQIYPADAFDFMLKNNGYVGMITHLLHDPRKMSEADAVAELPTGLRQVTVSE
jgi:hypothetical protein